MCATITVQLMTISGENNEGNIPTPVLEATAASTQVLTPMLEALDPLHHVIVSVPNSWPETVLVHNRARTQFDPYPDAYRLT